MKGAFAPFILIELHSPAFHRKNSVDRIYWREGKRECDIPQTGRSIRFK